MNSIWPKGCSFAVHSTVRYATPINLEYKGTQFRYTPGHSFNDSDNLTCVMDSSGYTGAYKKAYELFSAISYAEVFKIKLGGGLTEVDLVKPLRQMQFSQIEHREFAISERRDILIKIAHIENELQDSILRLYRHAYSVNDPFSKMLFFWHALVFPDKDESQAVNYINEHIEQIKEEMPRYYDQAITTNNFSKKSKISDFGKYVQKAVRGSIAHIVREWSDYRSLEMDNVEQIGHVYYISEILQTLVEKRIGEELKVQIRPIHYVCKIEQEFS